MWNHYADHYRGAVLQFEANDELDSAWLMARPVKYQNDPPAIASARAWARCILRKDGPTYKELFSEFQYVKTPDWAYEREWRLVSLARAGEVGHFSDWGFDPRELVGVYLGPKCSKENEADILALLPERFEHVSVYRAHTTGADIRFGFQEIRKGS